MYICTGIIRGEIMKATIKKRVPIVLFVILAILLAFTAGYTVVNGVVFAAQQNVVAESGMDALSIGHMSDIHYFPLSHCYTDIHADNYRTSDFYDSMTGDTKLVLESGMILNSTVYQIIQDAKDGKAPHYIVASGDLSKNGEHVALIDVANSMRYLQNEVRKINGYADFQIFATPGNHDLYNHSGALYNPENGDGSIADGLGAAEFALIFAGLGYPDANLNGDNSAIKLTDWLPEEYWSSSFTASDEHPNGYQPSRNNTHFTINYYSDALNAVKNAATAEEKLELYTDVDDSKNVLTFTVEFTQDNMKGYSLLVVDSSDRVTEDVGAPVRMGEYEFLKKYATAQENDGYAANTAFGKEKFYLYDSVNQKIVQEKVSFQDVLAAFENGEPVYHDSGLAHLTGGRITQNCLDWLEEYTKTQTGDKTTLNEETYVATFHHNALPHFEQEDDILKDFTLYNWEYAVKRFLDMGVRYTLTGHMHSSDIMQYTDPEGRTLYDLETGSSVSYSSPRRYLTITRYDCYENGENVHRLGETFETNTHILESLATIASDKVYSTHAWDEAAYDAAMDAYKASPTEANWQAVFAANPDYFVYTLRHDEMDVMSYNEFINAEIYSILLERVVNHFLNEGLVDTLKNMLSGFLNKPNDNVVFNLVISILGGKDANEKANITGLADYLIDTIFGMTDGIDGLYPENKYPYTPFIGEGKTAETIYSNGGIDWVLSIVDDLLALEYGDATLASTVNPANSGKMPLKEIAAFIMLSHAEGTEIQLAANDAELQAIYAEIDDEFSEIPYTALPEYYTNLDREEFRFKNPVDAMYRKRMAAALKDVHEQAIDGRLAYTLFNKLLHPLYYDEDSLLKTFLTYKFDFSKAVDAGYIEQKAYNEIKKSLANISSAIPGLLSALGIKGVTIPKDFKIDTDNFVLNDIVQVILPALKKILGDSLGFNLVGDTLFDIADTFLESYLTDSFYVGLGGIADAIIVAYATDIRPDVTDMNDFTKPMLLQPHDGYAYGGEQMTYVSTLDAAQQSEVGAQFNAATQLNGRVPSRVTANFDTKDSTTAYTFSFYTEENVYGTFKYKTSENGEWTSVSTSPANARVNKAGYLEATASSVSKGITVTLSSVTKPQYVPLIDLGLAALSHGEVSYETTVGSKKVEMPYLYGEREDGSFWRDAADKNSIIYWNVHTVTVTGLSADTTYFYDLAGNYLTDGGDTLEFSLAQFAKQTKNYDKDHFTFKTAAGSDVDEFEFLTIADIQGMLESMYANSYKAVEALLANDATKNFDFLLNAGDMCDNGKNFYQWGWALDTYLPLFANTSQFFTAGNHESSSYALTDFFNYTLPVDRRGNPYQSADSYKGGVYYSFDYANAHFVVLNTNDTSASGLNSTQYKWLQDDLKATKQKWKFVLMHKSLYSGGSHSSDAEVVSMRKQLGTLFAQTGVNIVFAGHDHTYTTTHLLNAKGEIVDMSNASGELLTDAGVMYITLGTMGTKFYTYGENENTTPKFDGDNSMLETLDSQTFGKVSVKGGKITYKGYYYDATTKTVREISSITLTDDSAIALEALKAANTETKTYTIAFNGTNDLTSIIDESLLPYGYKLSYVVDGTEFASAGDINFKGGSAKVDVMLKSSTGTSLGKIATVNIEKENYGMIMGLAIGIPVAVVVIVIVVVVLVILKKKGVLGKKAA